MRILVISDSHRRGSIVEKIIEAQPTARHIFFLGDVTGDIEDLQYLYTDRSFHIVHGNCDFSSDYPSGAVVTVNSRRIFMTHGHQYGVKSSTVHIASAARQQNCEIALFGHTHVSHISYEDGLYLVNPGSCAESRGGKNSYAVIDIEANGILPNVIFL